MEVVNVDKPFKNVITERMSFDRYIVLAEYESEEDAKINLEQDVRAFKEEYKDEAWYKMAYPWSWATIKEERL